MSSRVLICGGGTGGHVFPAIAIANALKEMDSSIDIKFVGAKDKLEMKKVPEAGYEIEGLWISGFNRQHLFKNIMLPFKILLSLLKANKIIKSFMPKVVVGVGGYASGPTMWVANKKNIPVVVQEQNSFAGLTNKLMAKKAKRFCVAYDHMERFFPEKLIVKTGNPVRGNIANMDASRQIGLDTFGLSAEKKTILVIGGSLGARTINRSLQKDIDKITEAGHQVIWQTGQIYIDQILREVQTNGDTKILAFIKEMDKAYAAADIIISRAGALSIAELACVGKPVILVPSPNVAEDHQTKNALALVENDAAIMIKDKDAEENLVASALNLIKNENRCVELSTNVKQLAIPDAAKRIAKEIIEIAKK